MKTISGPFVDALNARASCFTQRRESPLLHPPPPPTQQPQVAAYRYFAAIFSNGWTNKFCFRHAGLTSVYTAALISNRVHEPHELLINCTKTWMWNTDLP